MLLSLSMFLKQCVPSELQIFHLFSGPSIFHIHHEWEIPPKIAQALCCVRFLIQGLAPIRSGDSQLFSVYVWFLSLTEECKICYGPSISINWRNRLECGRGKPDSLFWAFNHMGLSSHDTRATGASHSQMLREPLHKALSEEPPS